MLVYGDHSDRISPSAKLDELTERLSRLGAMPAGLDRHAALAAATIEAGRLVQGVADNGSPSEDLEHLLRALAQCLVRSWDSRFDDVGVLPGVPRPRCSAELELRVPEGFAHYCVYPEAYADAARRLKLSGAPRVIGIRSIGTTLGAVVAAALGAPSPVTVRPTGDPFARSVELPDGGVDPKAHYVIVDEGPGLSGSSFGAVADALDRHGVPEERIAFLPSHSGDLGPQASDVHRRRWAGAQRIAAEFDPRFLIDRFDKLRAFSAGRPFERRKFIAADADGRILLKFAGLGEIGERKLEIARTLHSAGWTAEPLALVHGFLAERWEEGRPLTPDESPVEEIGRYIGTRARLLPARDASGATAGELVAMCRRNVELGLGVKDAMALHGFGPSDLEHRMRRVCTDNKLGREEWLRLPSGRLLKTDALDHHRAHDLIGCQDPAWDVAGAIVEFDLGGGQMETLIAATGLTIDPDLLTLHLIAYPAFRLGQTEIAGAEGVTTARYRTALQKFLLHRACGSTRQQSSVG